MAADLDDKIRAASTHLLDFIMMAAEKQDKLHGLLLDACPGPHRFTQHRDGREKWCNRCRYTIYGQCVDDE